MEITIPWENLYDIFFFYKDYNNTGFLTLPTLEEIPLNKRAEAYVVAPWYFDLVGERYKPYFYLMLNNSYIQTYGEGNDKNGYNDRGCYAYINSYNNKNYLGVTNSNYVKGNKISPKHMWVLNGYNYNFSPANYLVSDIALETKNGNSFNIYQNYNYEAKMIHDGNPNTKGISSSFGLRGSLYHYKNKKWDTIFTNPSWQSKEALYIVILLSEEEKNKYTLFKK